MAQRGPYHQRESSQLTAHPRYAGQGRPTPRPPRKASVWHLQAHVRPAQAALEHRKQCHACFVLGTNLDASELSDPEVIQADKGQSRVAGGFRLLNDPLFFVSSWLVKKPSRIDGLLLVMPLALLVDSVTPRRLRHP